MTHGQENDTERSPRIGTELNLQGRALELYYDDFQPDPAEPSDVDIQWNGGDDGPRQSGRVVLLNNYRRLAEYVIHRCGDGSYRLSRSKNRRRRNSA